MLASMLLCGQRGSRLVPRGTRPPRGLGVSGRCSSVWGTGRPWTRQAMRSQKGPLRRPEEASWGAWTGRRPWGGVLSSGNPLLCARRPLCVLGLCPRSGTQVRHRVPHSWGGFPVLTKLEPLTRARPQVLPLPGLGPPPRAMTWGRGESSPEPKAAASSRGHSGRWGPRSEWRRDSPVGHSLATGRRLPA